MNYCTGAMLLDELAMWIWMEDRNLIIIMLSFRQCGWKEEIRNRVALLIIFRSLMEVNVFCIPHKMVF